MKTILIILVLVLGVGFLIWNKPATTTNVTTTVVPSGQTTTNTNPNGPDYQPNREPVTTVDTSVSANVSVGTTKTFKITGSNFSFDPKQITVKKGDTVKITFVNTNGVHDFKIDAFNAATKQISAGQQETITFIADKTGTFQYYCSVGNHKTMGMVGTLTVTP